jgi:hypothetical protein
MKTLCNPFSLLICSFLFFVSCHSSSDDSTQENSDSTQYEAPDVSYNKELTDVANFIAGLPVDTSSSLYELTQSTQWQSYEKRMNEKWSIFFDEANEHIIPWVENELGYLSQSHNTLFYPFSGPDYINAHLFFPDMENNIFFGLEPPGSIPNPLEIKSSDLQAYYKMYEQSIHHIIHLSFFRTHSMKEDLSSMEVDGAAPVIMIFLARAGKKIIDIQPFHFGENGDLIYDTIFNSFKPNQKFQNGVEFSFRNEDDPTIQKLTYFSIDISDGYIEKNPGVKSYLDNIDTSCVVYIKSASYLLHDPFFVTITNTILDKATILLQDDSGMPYKYFDEDWKVQLYGTYDRPIPIFSKYYQKQLHDDYIKSNPSELAFRRGYAKKTNLQLARKDTKKLAI